MLLPVPDNPKRLVPLVNQASVTPYVFLDWKDDAIELLEGDVPRSLRQPTHPYTPPAAPAGTHRAMTARAKSISKSLSPGGATVRRPSTEAKAEPLDPAQQAKLNENRRAHPLAPHSPPQPSTARCRFQQPSTPSTALDSSTLYPPQPSTLHHPLPSTLHHPPLRSTLHYPPLSPTHNGPPLPSTTLYPPPPSTLHYPLPSTTHYPPPSTTLHYPLPSTTLYPPPPSADCPLQRLRLSKPFAGLTTPLSEPLHSSAHAFCLPPALLCALEDAPPSPFLNDRG